MKNQVLLLSLIIFILSISNCKKTVIEQINLTGTITGKVYYIDENEYHYYSKSGIKIEIENTSFSTYSDNNGEYTIENIPTGTYNIIYSKEGCSTHKITGFQIIGGGDYPVKMENILIRKKSSTISSNLSVEYNEDLITFSATISPEAIDTVQRGFLLLISDKNAVSYDHNLDYYWQLSSAGNRVSITLDESILSRYIPGFDQNITYYAIAYGISQSYCDFYFDTQKGSNVFSGMNESATNVVSFTIP
jgi:hypothetical protein